VICGDGQPEKKKGGASDPEIRFRRSDKGIADKAREIPNVATSIYQPGSLQFYEPDPMKVINTQLELVGETPVMYI
jgi:hypothetical protein